MGKPSPAKAPSSRFLKSVLGSGTPKPQKEMETHLLLLLSQAVPHGGHDFGHIPEGGAGVLSLYGGLSVSEEERVGGHWLLWLIGVLFLLLLWVLGLFPWVS